MPQTLSFVIPSFWEFVTIFVVLSLFVLPALIGGSLMWVRLRNKVKNITHSKSKK